MDGVAQPKIRGRKMRPRHMVWNRRLLLVFKLSNKLNWEHRPHNAHLILQCGGELLLSFGEN